jgi:hypothetical protein
MDKRSKDKRPIEIAKVTKGRRRHKADRASKSDKRSIAHIVDMTIDYYDKRSIGSILKKWSMVQIRLGLSKSGLRFALAALV